MARVLRIEEEEVDILGDAIATEKSELQKAIHRAQGGETGFDVPDLERALAVLKDIETRLYRQ
jgi:hypothetical protein